MASADPAGLNTVQNCTRSVLSNTLTAQSPIVTGATDFLPVSVGCCAGKSLAQKHDRRWLLPPLQGFAHSLPALCNVKPQILLNWQELGRRYCRSALEDLNTTQVGHTRVETREQLRSLGPELGGGQRAK